MSKILFPTDFSETANNAFIYALNLAKSTDAELFVLNCYEMVVLSTTSSGNPDMVQEMYQSIELNHFEQFKEQVPLMRKMAQEQGLSEVKMTFLFEEGLLQSVIRKVIKDENIDYIVMGTNGANSLEKKLLGSNTVNIMTKVDIPILSVPTEAKFTPSKIKTIGFATMLRESDKKGIYTIAKIAKKLGADFKCLHILRDENSDYDETLNAWIAEFTPLGITFHTVLNRDLEQSVFYFIDKYNVDMMCIVKRQMNFFEKLFSSSLSKKLAYHSYVPVFVLREEK
ncbi:MAG TPA: universal stress protein [Flavobacterium sp.]|nr:universal stress protein [Flavobacterium sp.]